MDISYNWLRELTDVSLPPQELAERLTMAGLAVDAVREAGDDFVLEFDLTSNRPDCLSHLGIAREAAALAGARVRLPDLTAKNMAGGGGEVTPLGIQDGPLCPRSAARAGGAETEISGATADVLIESAYFDPHSVRRTSKALGLQTDASYRFERGVDYEGVRRAQDRCVALICEIAGGTATADAIDVYPRRITPPVVYLRPRRVEELAGLAVGVEESLRILTSLGFNTVGRDAGGGDATDESHAVEASRSVAGERAGADEQSGPGAKPFFRA